MNNLNAKLPGVKLNLDSDPSMQGKDSYRFALNCVTDKNFIGSIVTEKGNIEVGVLPGNAQGIIQLDRFSFVIFTDDGSIVEYNSNSEELITHVLNQSDLEFNYPIHGVHRMIRGCERIIYWCDGNNDDRHFSLDRSDKYKNLDGTWDINKFNFNPDVSHPKVDCEVVPFGGNLEYGTYSFVFEYLDDFENILFRSPASIDYVPINDSSNQGAFNLSTEPSSGGKPASTKSIRVSLTNIETEATLIRVIALKNSSGNGLTSEGIVMGRLIPISGDSINFTYLGFNPGAGDYRTDVITASTILPIYESSNSIEKVDERLVRGGIKEGLNDYSTYQTYASKVCAKYVSSELSVNNQNYYRLNSTEIGGEIKSYAIIYVHRNGSTSPPFIIPGRRKVESDSEIIFTNPDIEKWQLLDSSIADSISEEGYEYSGQMGYFESDQKYNNPVNFCEFNEDLQNSSNQFKHGYWGLDCDGIPLQDLNVRYHAIPDRSKIKLVEGTTQNNTSFVSNSYTIGVLFNNIEYPNDDVVGHYFVSNERTITNNRIITKGVSIPDGAGKNSNGSLYTNSEWNNYVHTNTNPATSVSETRQRLFTSDHLFDYSVPGGEGVYYVYEGEFDIYAFQEQHVTNDGKRFFDKDTNLKNLYINVKFNRLGRYDLSTDVQIFKVNDVVSLPVNTSFKSIYYNASPTVPKLIYNLDIGSNQVPLFPSYVSVRQLIDVFPDHHSIQYKRITDINETVSFNGDAFISKYDITNVSEIEIKDLPMLSNRFSDNPVPFFGGAYLAATLVDDDVYVYGELLQNLYSESIINSNLRVNGRDCNEVWGLQGTRNIWDYFMFATTEVKRAEKTESGYLRNDFCEMPRLYNKDYSFKSNFNKYLPLNLTFNYCSKCLNYSPSKIIYSEKSFQSDLSDNYRVYRVNNFKDLPSNRGSIVKIDYADGKIITRTEQACYLMQPNPQVLELKSETVNIGTGDFLSLNAAELNLTEIGYGGQQHPHESIKTEAGLVWVDRARGKVLKIAGDVKELNRNGLYAWFFNNLKDSSSNCILTYDTNNERIILSLKDEWTISYCMLSEGWKSWHSYKPELMAKSYDTFYSIFDKKLWKHDEGLYNYYYNESHSQVFEYTINNSLSFYPNSVMYNNKSYTINNNLAIEDINNTFDQLIVYNGNQSTGLINLEYDNGDNIFYSASNKTVRRTDKTYRVGQLMDCSTSNDIWIEDQSDYITPTGQGFIDKVPKDVDINLDQVSQSMFRDKFINVRLFKNENDKKFVTNVVGTLSLYYKQNYNPIKQNKMAKEFTIKGLDYFFKKDGKDVYGRGVQDTHWFKLSDSSKKSIMSQDNQTKKEKVAQPKVNSKLSKSLKNLKKR